MARFVELSAALTGLAVFVIGTITTTACNFGGTMCEYALIGPSEAGVINRNIATLESSPDSLRLLAEEKDVLFGGRLDLYAKGKTSSIVGSFGKGDLLSYQVSSAATWAVVFSVRERSSAQHVIDINLYVLDSGLTKRTFTLECTRESSAYGDPEYRVLNPAYDSVSRVISFDFESNCKYRAINDNVFVRFGSDVFTSGRVTLQLDKALLLSAATGARPGDIEPNPTLTTPTTSAMEESIKTLDECREEALARLERIGTPDYQVCQAGYFYGDKYTKVFEAYGTDRNGARKDFYASCGSLDFFWAATKDSLLLICRNGSTSERSGETSTAEGTHLTVSAQSLSGGDKTFTLRSKCKGFDIRGAQFAPTGAITFEVISNCTEVLLDSMSITLEGQPFVDDFGPGVPRGEYGVSFSKANVPVAMRKL